MHTLVSLLSSSFNMNNMNNSIVKKLLIPTERKNFSLLQILRYFCHFENIWHPQKYKYKPIYTVTLKTAVTMSAVFLYPKVTEMPQSNFFNSDSMLIPEFVCLLIKIQLMELFFIECYYCFIIFVIIIVGGGGTMFKGI